MFNRILSRSTYLKSLQNKYSSQSSAKIDDLFMNKEVQRILLKITGCDYAKIFSKRKQKIVPYQYEFATEKRLKELQDIIAAKAIKKLQMPPVMDIRKPINEVLSKDPELQGYIRTKLICTDISTKTTNRDRIITVRELDGTLRKATWEERDRMNQIYFPMEGRELETPKLYDSPYFERLLNEGSYIFVLNSACLQYEPDHPEYHRVTRATYDHIYNNRNFEVLRSTRHFGPMAFYLIYEKKMDYLLCFMIEQLLIHDAADIINLFYIIHSNLKPSVNLSNSKETDIIKDYIENHSERKDELDSTLQGYIEYQQQQENLTKKESISQV